MFVEPSALSSVSREQKKKEEHTNTQAQTKENKEKQKQKYTGTQSVANRKKKRGGNRRTQERTESSFSIFLMLDCCCCFLMRQVQSAAMRAREQKTRRETRKKKPCRRRYRHTHTRTHNKHAYAPHRGVPQQSSVAVRGASRKRKKSFFGSRLLTIIRHFFFLCFSSYASPCVPGLESRVVVIVSFLFFPSSASLPRSRARLSSLRWEEGFAEIAESDGRRRDGWEVSATAVLWLTTLITLLSPSSFFFLFASQVTMANVPRVLTRQ